MPYTDVIQLEWALRYTWTYNVQLGLIYILYLSPNDGQNSFRRSIRMSTSTSQPTPNPSRLFSLYLSHAEKHDRDQAESWKAGAEGILVFVSRIFRFGFIIPSLMNKTLTATYYVFRI